ncbi:hypothetical protein [Sulfurimonas sp.]|uniref:hypothetical protein n=1 Tax=Sulfurimonas sp. TaxID=2022749 RepID=UPI0025E1A1A8|nr:hypothetical protein [Sulfurimonas sp.]MDD5156857.1 hypothetical protein [Sulfurimonas sp.]
MKKLLLIILLFLYIPLNAIEDLKSLSQLKENSLVFLVFEKKGCPWCTKYEIELQGKIVEKYSKNIKFFKVEKGSEIFSQLRKEFGFKIIIYPMTYMIKSNDKKASEIVEEIYGYQTEEYVEELLLKTFLIK